VARSRRATLWNRISAGELRNVPFRDFCRLIEQFGFELRRVSGSHYIYRHPAVPRPLSLQSQNGEAKPYQISQVLALIEQYRLTMD